MVRAVLHHSPSRRPCVVTGNVELWSGAFLPVGAAHIEVPGAARVAQQLGIHYADAVVRAARVQVYCGFSA